MFVFTSVTMLAVALFVFAFITAAKEEVAVRIALLVFEFTSAVPTLMAEASEEVAVVTSERVASEPVSRPAPVNVLTPLDQTSATTDPKLESVRELYAQTDAGRVVAKEEDALNTAVSVFVFTSETTPAVALSVLAFITAASEEVAVMSALFVFELTLAVPAVIAVAKEDDADETVVPTVVTSD